IRWAARPSHEPDPGGRRARAWLPGTNPPKLATCLPARRSRRAERRITPRCGVPAARLRRSGGRPPDRRCLPEPARPSSAARPRGGDGVRVAATDCGPNSVRLLVADVNQAAGRLSDVDRRLEIVRLGQGVDATGRLAADALARTLHVLRSYRQIIEEASASATRLVATSATRDA